MLHRITLFLFLAAWAGCRPGPDRGNGLFEKVDSAHSGIRFVNTVTNTKEFNIFNYRNFYNGGGVALGDINNDGLTDVFFTANMGSNKLYLNKGNLQFEDITDKSGVGGSGAWGTGVVMADINHDGWLDIYVCNAGYIKGKSTENQLWINNQNLTFTEKAAEYNLNEDGYTTHAAFFDYDRDGDLDCYILNNSFLPVNTLNYSNNRDLYAEDWPVEEFVKGGGDKLLRNDEIPPKGGKKGGFTDVTRQSGIYGSLIGFGLGVTVGDVNGDYLPDIYVSNDFFERDYLYINQGNGTFKEEIENWIEHHSHASMGADMADINNDGFPEIFTTEMLPDDEHRLKTTTLFENYNIYQLKQERGFYHQYMQNSLQLNHGVAPGAQRKGAFSEIAFYAGVAASDWSWGALMFDADNDGYRDIYVCNGIYKDVIDQDFIDFFADEIIQKMTLTGIKEEVEKVLEKMPSTPIPNKAFRNRGDLTFEDMGKKWGIDIPSFSNGAAYGDLDNDGDLDLVVNNVNMEAFVFRNTAEKSQPKPHSLTVQLKGDSLNTYAVGSRVLLYRGTEVLSTEMIPTRGFQSSVDYNLVFGLGPSAQVDSLVVVWPNGKKTVQNAPAADQKIVIEQRSASGMASPVKLAFTGTPLLETLSMTFPAHTEDNFADFYNEPLLFRKQSNEGPKSAVGDLNGDGLADVFVCGGPGQAGQVYFQQKGRLVPSKQPALEQDAAYEDTAALLFDADGDGDSDLFVGSGGNAESAGGDLLQDRLYLNDGKGIFSYSKGAFPPNGLNTAVAVAMDIDRDGDQDLFVGTRSMPRMYGIPPFHYVYENNGKGQFRDVAKTVAPELKILGMVTDATTTDIDGDGQAELIVIGEWMAPRVFRIENGHLNPVNNNLSDYSGWWYAVKAEDIDNDGDQDLVLGNRGENFYFKGTKEAPAKLWVWDFDMNGIVDKIMTRRINGKDVPIPLKKELVAQIPSLKKQNLKHSDYADKSIQELFPKEVMDKAFVREGNYFRSAVALNDGKGNFTLSELPKEVQFSCVKAICCTDLNGDGKKDLLLGGNDYGFMPQFSRLDASFGHVLLQQSTGQFQWVPYRESGFFIRGEIKQFAVIPVAQRNYILTLINHQSPQLFATR